jgi:hypothetical protein
MPFVDRILVMNLDQLAAIVVDLLIKSHRHLVGVNLFYIASLPALFAKHIEPVSASTSRKTLPIGEFPTIHPSYSDSYDDDCSFLYDIIFGEEPHRLDHHRVITFENFLHKIVVGKHMVGFATMERKHCASRIRKLSVTGFMNQHDVSLRFRWQKDSRIDLIKWLSKQIQGFLHENTNARSHDWRRLRMSPGNFHVTENSSRSTSVAVPDSTMNGTPS